MVLNKSGINVAQYRGDKKGPRKRLGAKQRGSRIFNAMVVVLPCRAELKKNNGAILS